MNERKRKKKNLIFVHPHVQTSSVQQEKNKRKNTLKTALTTLFFKTVNNTRLC
jgi:hypothetical protein